MSFWPLNARGALISPGGALRQHNEQIFIHPQIGFLLRPASVNTWMAAPTWRSMNSRRQWPLAMDLRASAFQNYRPLAGCLLLAKKAARSRVLRTRRRRRRNWAKRRPAVRCERAPCIYISMLFLLLCAFEQNTHTNRQLLRLPGSSSYFFIFLFLALRVFFTWLTILFSTLESAVSNFQEFTDFAL